MSSLAERVRRPLKWARLIAWVYVVAALGLGYFIPRIHIPPIPWINETLSPDKAIAFLSAVSSGMMAFTGIVFSLFFVMLQFASSAYSPHLVPLLARNRVLTHACGVFTGTFLYSLMALRSVGSTAGGTAELTLWVAFAWLLLSVYFLLRLVGVFASLAISDVLDMLGDSGHREIDRVYTPYSAQAEASAREARLAITGSGVQTVAHRGRPQYVISIDAPRLVALARASGGLIRIPLAIGDAVVEGAHLAYVEGSSAPVSDDALREAIVLASDRSREDGPKHDMRLLVDIAIRALSTAVNDPTTAVHSLDQLEAILVRLGQSNLEVGRVRDSAGVLRLVYDSATWEEYLELAVAEIQQYGAGAVQVERRLAALLELLERVVPEERRGIVARFARERLVAIRRSFPAGPLRDLAERHDRQGLGH